MSQKRSKKVRYVYGDKKFQEMNPGLKLDTERCTSTLYSICRSM
jgi:hypothetical protein